MKVIQFSECEIPLNSISKKQVETLIVTLNSIPGVESINSNPKTDSIKIVYDTRFADFLDFYQEIKNVGYRFIEKDVVLQITGMNCASCCVHLEGAVNELHGVTFSSASLKSNTLQVRYLSEIIPLESIKQSIKNIGYQAALQSQSNAGIG